LDKFGKALKGNSQALQKLGEQREDWIHRDATRKAKKLERIVSNA
jgi:hypothetical protein